MNDLKCPNCGSANVVEWGQVECDDEESLSLFCEEWLCKNCNQTFVGDIVDGGDEFEDDDDDFDGPDDFGDDIDESTNLPKPRGIIPPRPTNWEI